MTTHQLTTLFPANNNVIVDSRTFCIPVEPLNKQIAKWISYVVVDQDTNHDGYISADDLQSLALSHADGSGYHVYLTRLTRMMDSELIGANDFYAFYEQNMTVFVAHIAFRTYTLPRHGGVNSRVKDIVDMALLHQLGTLNRERLREAISTIFRLRDTHPHRFSHLNFGVSHALSRLKWNSNLQEWAVPRRRLSIFGVYSNSFSGYYGKLLEANGLARINHTKNKTCSFVLGVIYAG